MKSSLCAAAARIGIGAVLLLVQSLAAQSTELKAFSVLPLKPFLEELGPQFERTTGHKLTITYNVSAALKREIDAGETFEVALLLPTLIDDLVKRGIRPSL
jgi:molybdate transport system substrate-binding protein